MVSVASQESAAFWTASRPNVGAWLEHYRVSAEAPWRSVLMDALRPFAPFRAVLDIGCHCGPNLQRLRAVFPACPYTGLDVNGEALGYGRHVAVRDGYGADTTWIYGSILEPQGFHDRAFDLVFTSSCLSVVGPEDIGQAVREMARLTDRVLVFQEPIEDRHEGIFHQWNHDYEAALGEHADAFHWASPSEGVLIGVRG